MDQKTIDACMHVALEKVPNGSRIIKIGELSPAPTRRGWGWKKLEISYFLNGKEYNTILKIREIEMQSAILRIENNDLKAENSQLQDKIDRMEHVLIEKFGAAL